MTDLKTGEVYKYIYKYHYFVLVKLTDPGKDRGAGLQIYENDRPPHFYDSGMFTAKTSVEKATAKEKAWLELAIAAGKPVPMPVGEFPEIINEYLIY